MKISITITRYVERKIELDSVTVSDDDNFNFNIHVSCYTRKRKVIPEGLEKRISFSVQINRKSVQENFRISIYHQG